MATTDEFKEAVVDFIALWWPSNTWGPELAGEMAWEFADYDVRHLRKAMVRLRDNAHSRSAPAPAQVKTEVDKVRAESGDISVFDPKAYCKEHSHTWGILRYEDVTVGRSERDALCAVCLTYRSFEPRHLMTVGEMEHVAEAKRLAEALSRDTDEGPML